MAKPLEPRRNVSRGAAAQVKTSLPRDLVEEIRRSTKPTQAENAISRLSRAVELLERGDSRGAAAEAAKAKELSPRSPAVREVLGMALYGEERWQDALTEMKAYKRMSGRLDQNHIIGDCLRALGRPKDVIPLAEETLKAKVPNEVKAEAVVVAASALADLKQYTQALAFLRRATTRQDISEGYTLRLWYVEADILERSGRKDEAERIFRTILRHDPSAFDVAERLVQLG